MSNKSKELRPALERAVAVLREERDRTGQVSPQLLRAKAIECGYSGRHLQRCLKRPADAPITAGAVFELTDQIVTMIFLYCGVLARAFDELTKLGLPLPSLSTFKRRIVEQVGTAQLAYARQGTVGFRDHQIYLKNSYPHRMHSVLLDHTELPIWVVPRGYRQAQKPWLTGVMDAKSRYLLAWVLTWGRPSAEEVRASLMQAFTLGVAPDGVTVIGGRPNRAVWDRGLEFLSTLITESCLRLGVVPVALPAFAPHLKGRLERFWLTLKSGLLPPLPGYTEGPRDLRGNSALAAAAMGEDAFMMRLATWIDSYNSEHVNGSTGKTALQMWQEDPTPLEEIPAEQLRIDFLVAKERCRVSKNGVRFDKIDFVDDGLKKMIGRTVEIRHLPHDRSFIEVFADGTHLCTAYPASDLPAEQQQNLMTQRAAERAQARARFSTANRLRRGTDDARALEVDRDGRRFAVDPAAAPLTGDRAALDRLLGLDDSAGEHDDGDDGLAGSRLF